MPQCSRIPDSHPRPRTSKRRSYSSGSESDSDIPPAKPPRRSNTQRDRRPRDRDYYDSYEEHPRRDDRKRDNRGYVSDDRHNRPRRDHDDRDRRDRRRDDRDRSRDRSRGDRYDDRDRRDRDSRRDDRDRRDRHRDDRRDDRKDDRKKSTPYDALFSLLAKSGSGGSGSRRDDRDRRDRYDDRDYDRRDRDRDGNPGQPEWQKQALGMFTTYALPIIKKEGTKYLHKQAGNLMAKKR